MATDTTGNYCAKHERHYGKLEQCADCRAARSASVAPGSPKADTSPLRVIAARYRLNEAACWDVFGTIVRDDVNGAAKMSAESGKWATRADELESKIIEIEHDQWLRDQKMLLGGGGN